MLHTSKQVADAFTMSSESEIEDDFVSSRIKIAWKNKYLAGEISDEDFPPDIENNNDAEIHEQEQVLSVKSVLELIRTTTHDASVPNVPTSIATILSIAKSTPTNVQTPNRTMTNGAATNGMATNHQRQPISPIVSNSHCSLICAAM